MDPEWVPILSLRSIPAFRLYLGKLRKSFVGILTRFYSCEFRGKSFLAATPVTQHLAGPPGLLFGKLRRGHASAQGTEPNQWKIARNKEFAAEVVFEVNL
jgi:hypothetical protein